ncbi:MAG: LacI family DNA-binding transcriptional regulator [Sphingomonadales bacterium]|nr:LacI family DNA-binding transcriptional regulator [Sphingomonadales bacterium]
MAGGRKSGRRGEGPTVADVARAAGVSPMTVSRVVNRQTGIAPPTRAKVEAAIAQLRYVPNLAARRLAGRGPCRLALLHDNPSAAFMTELLIGSLDAARAQDAELLIEFYDPEEPTEAVCERLRGHRIEGLLLPAPLCDDRDLVEALRDGGFAIARIAATRPIPETIAVEIDNEAATHAMTAHLIALGHRRIGFIAGPPGHHCSALRVAGYVRALAEAGLPFDPACVVTGDFTYRSGLATSEALLALTPPPSAIFASNDDMAAAAVASAYRRHLGVPDDLSICGFDDTAMARSIWPEITTIRQPAAEMARRAALLLIAQLRGGGGATVLRLDFELLRRASDAPPP